MDSKKTGGQSRCTVSCLVVMINLLTFGSATELFSQLLTVGFYGFQELAGTGGIRLQRKVNFFVSASVYTVKITFFLP